MALYLFSYDLNKSEKDYPELAEYLRLIGARKVLKSEWLVRNGATRDAVYNGVKANLGHGDGPVSLSHSVGSRGQPGESARRNLERTLKADC
jgi:hypothetical protein